MRVVHQAEAGKEVTYFCAFCIPKNDDSTHFFGLREIGQVDGRPVEVVTCPKHYNCVLGAGEYARMDALVEAARIAAGRRN